MVIDAIDPTVEGKEEEEEMGEVTGTIEGIAEKEREKEAKTIDRARLRRLIAKYTL